MYLYSHKAIEKKIGGTLDSKMQVQISTIGSPSHKNWRSKAKITKCGHIRLTFSWTRY